jgi:hypothetical protein
MKVATIAVAAIVAALVAAPAHATKRKPKAITGQAVSIR